MRAIRPVRHKPLRFLTTWWLPRRVDTDRYGLSGETSNTAKAENVLCNAWRQFRTAADYPYRELYSVAIAPMQPEVRKLTFLNASLASGELSKPPNRVPYGAMQR